MCYFMNLHKGHKLLRINDEEELKKENLTIEGTNKEFDNNKNKLEEIKNKIENEIIKIDKSYEKVDNEVTKSYKLKHEQLIKEENNLKDKLKNEVTKIKENLELNLTKINEIIRKCERIMKGIKTFQNEEEQMIKKLNYISKINKNHKEINLIFQELFKNLNISFNDNNIKYEEYYFSGMPIPKNIKFSDIKINSFKVSWELDNIKIIDIDLKQIKYNVELKEENIKFISMYEGKENNCIIDNLKENTKYSIRICSIYNNIKSNYSEIYDIKTNSLDSIILNKTERKKEYIEKLLEWSGFKTLKLIYRGTRDGMTNKDFHNKCDDKGKTICLFLNDKGNIFGGYSSIPWAKDGGDKIANDCFLFTLSNIYNTEPTKFPYSQKRSISLELERGPSFGYGSDLAVQNDFCNKNNTWSYFPCSYKDIIGKGKSIFTGDFDNSGSNFYLKELEVFECL